MKILLFLISLLFVTAQVHAQPTSLGDVLVTSVDNIVYVQSTTGLQAAITTVCAEGGGTVVLPNLQSTPNGYVQNTSLTLCSNLNLIGAGRSDTAATCPTLITTTLSSGDLFPIAYMKNIHISDLCVEYTATSGSPNAVFRLRTGQYITIERVTIFAGPASNELLSGPPPTSVVGFQIGLQLNSDDNAPAGDPQSTIYNHFIDITMYDIAEKGVGCLLFPSSTGTTPVGNNYFDNVNCIGGYEGVGLQATGQNTVQPAEINENVFHGGQFSAIGGTGVLISSVSTRDLTMVGADIEGSTYGLHLATGNDGFSCYGCNIYSNTTGNNIYVANGSTRTVITGNIGDQTFVQNYSLDQVGNILVNGLSLPASQSATSASAGSASSLPGLPAGYLMVNIGGVNYKIPYYKP